MIETEVAFALSLLASLAASASLQIWGVRKVLVVTGGGLAALLTLGATAWLAGGLAPRIEVKILEPVHDAEVGQRVLVRGEAIPAPVVLYVLVHPLGTDQWWVQDVPLVQNDGRWNVNAYIGAETLGRGELFEILAVATNENWVLRLLRDARLAPAQRLATIPEAFARSNLVVVKRKP